MTQKADTMTHSNETQNNERMNPEPLTTGEQYVRDYLPKLTDGTDESWLAESIDSGTLLACPRCRFLHLPFLVFPESGMAGRGIPAPVDACDVCAHIPDACREALPEATGVNALLEATALFMAQEVAGERRRRAELLLDLFRSGMDAASALFVLRATEARLDLARLARTPTAELKSELKSEVK